MNKYRIGAIAVAATLVVGVVCVALSIEHVRNGYVGVAYDMNGGVQDNILPQGYHLVSPTKKITEYSIATEQLYMSKDSKEGSEDDDSFNVTCKDGSMNVDLELSYKFDPENVVKVFKKYRGIDGETVVKQILRGKIKTYTSEAVSDYTVLEAYMGKKAEVNNAVKKRLQEKLAPYGVTIEDVTISEARVDPSIKKAITERSRTAQELEVEKQKQEKVRLQAETAVIEAEGKAKKLGIEAEAEAKRNQIISASITQNLIDMELAKARQTHGWVEIQGASAIIKEK